MSEKEKKVEKDEQEKNVTTITLTVSSEELEEAIQKAYIKNASKFNIPGFRKGKVPRKMIERYYGEGVFYEDAVNIVVPTVYEKAVIEQHLDPVDRPEIDVNYDKLFEEKVLEFTAKITVKPEVKMGNYKGISVDKVVYNVTDEDVNAEIERLRERNSRMITVSDKPVERGDTATIDFEGFVDGAVFEGGKGDNYDLVIGSNSFIPGFEDQLVGVNIDEDVDVEVKFPDDYHAEELKGKEVLFKVKVKKIAKKELPELDDEFVKEVSEFDTVDELKKSITDKLEEQFAEKTKREYENAMIESVTNLATVEIPQCMIEQRIDSLLKEFEQSIAQQGINMETYLQYTGVTNEALRAQFAERAQTNVKTTLALEEIAKLEKIEVSADEVDAELSRIAELYKMEKSQVAQFIPTDDLTHDISIRKTIELLLGESKTVEAKSAKAKKPSKTEEVTEEKPKKTAKKPAAKTTKAKTTKE